MSIFGWRLVWWDDSRACPLCGLRGDYYSPLTQAFYGTLLDRTNAEVAWFAAQEAGWAERERALRAVIDDLRGRVGVTESAAELLAATRAYSALARASAAE